MAKDYMFLLSLDIVKKDFENWVKTLFKWSNKVTICENVWKNVVYLGNKLDLLITTANSENEDNLKEIEIKIIDSYFDSLNSDLKPSNSSFSDHEIYYYTIEEKNLASFIREISNIKNNLHRCLTNHEKYGSKIQVVKLEN